MKYAKISIPKALAELVKKFIKENPELGYRSIADFISEATRMHIKRMQRKLQK